MHALGRDSEVHRSSLLLASIMGEFDTTKARTELGWEPRPMDDVIREAAAYFLANG